MGKAAKWLKGLLGMNKTREKSSIGDSSSSSVSSNRNEKKRWSFAKSVNDKTLIQGKEIEKDAAWLRSYLSETKRDQNEHAIAVAAATAAAADAAVAAAQAAVAVVRLTNRGRGISIGGCRDQRAAIRIQSVFRGYLARKALRALKGLVKIQALVRGYLVRKRATATLRSMQALIRAQNAVRSQRARRSMNKENRYVPENRPRKSIESEFHSKRLYTSYDFGSFNESPKIVEIDTYKTRSRTRKTNAALSECGEEFFYNGMSSPFPCPTPNRITIPDSKSRQDYELYFAPDECKFSTAHNTPRFATSVRSNTPATPAKSVCGDTYFRPYSNYPSYMANTQSFNAKLRSHSAPKQRPEPGSKKRLSLNEVMASRNSISSVRMQRSYHEEDDEDSSFY